MKNFILVTIFFLSLTCYSQTYIKGIVKDSLDTPIYQANIVVYDIEANYNMSEFITTDEKGRYRLKLKKKKKYLFEISYMGFGTIEDTLYIGKKNLIKNYTLKEQENVLEIVDIELPVYIRNDTTFYKVDKFTNGKERKLKNVLKKLPGIEVGKDGEVMVNGKKVTTMLVDGKPFFGGGSKLAVNNIPADAIAEIQAIDNYNSIAFLKTVNNSDKMAMNITLKKDKNKFIFGDIEVGKGQKKYNKLHSSLFRYAPKSNLGLILNLNNIGQNTLNDNDIKRFIGASNPIFGESVQDSDLAIFTENRDFLNSKKQFGAFNILKNISKRFELSGFTVFSNQNINNLTESVKEYSDIVEYVEVNDKSKNTLSLTKLNADYKVSDNNLWKFKTILKKNRTNRESFFSSVNNIQNNEVQNIFGGIQKNINQDIEWHNNIHKKHVFSTLFSYRFSDYRPVTKWKTNQLISDDLKPIIHQNPYILFSENKMKDYRFTTKLKYFNILDSHNQLHFSFSNSYQDYYLNTNDGQLVVNKTVNFDGFTNDFNFNLHTLGLSISHRFHKKEKYNLIYGLELKRFGWDLRNLDKKYTEKKNVLLPKIDFTYDFSKSKSFSLEYEKSSNFNNPSNLAAGRRLASYQSFFYGNENLENELFHNFSAIFLKFNFYQGTTIVLTSSYIKKEQGVLNAVEFNGVSQYTSYVNAKNPFEHKFVNTYVKKRIGDFNLKLNASLTNSIFKQVINNENVTNRSTGVSYNFEAEILFDNLPQINIGISQDRKYYTSLKKTSLFRTTQPYLSVTYDFLKNFQVTYDYSLEQQNSPLAKIRYQMMDASLYYHKEDSPWVFRFYVNNFLDNRFKQSNTFSNYIISNTKTYLQPRVIMSTITYKL